MTVIFDMTAMGPRSLVGIPNASQAGDAAALDFQALLDDRALLDAVPRSLGDGLRNGSKHDLAPAARRFDEAPLFGHAYLAMRQLQGSTPHGPSHFIRPTAIATNETFTAGGAAVSRLSDRSVTTVARPAVFAGSTGSSARRWEGGRPPVGAQDSIAAPSTRLAELADEDIGQTAAAAGLSSNRDIGRSLPQGEPHGVSVTAGERAPLSRSNSLAGQMISVYARPASPRPTFLPSGPGEAAPTEGAAERANQARSHFINKLGPLHLVMREDGSMLFITARVAALTQVEGDELERRLRKVVGEETLRLAALQINGRERPSQARV